jgi:glycerol uptake facilitator-like aquaporin
VARAGLVLREGFVFGVISGAFGLMVRLVAIAATNDITPTPLADFVTSALGLLIVGGAARKLAVATKDVNSGWQMGAIAGGVGEAIRTVLAGFILPYLPFAQVALAHISPAVTRAANDTGTLLINLGLDLVLAMVFGALIGWLGAWSILRLGPRRDPPNGQI